MTRALRHFGLVVRNLDKSLEFYCGALGMRVVRRMEESGGFLDTILADNQVKVTTVKLGAAEGSALLELLHFQVPLAKESGWSSLFQTGATHFALTVKDLRKLHISLEAHGAEFLSAPQSSPDGRALVCFGRDPEGNLIEFVEELTP